MNIQSFQYLANLFQERTGHKPKVAIVGGNAFSELEAIIKQGTGYRVSAGCRADAFFELIGIRIYCGDENHSGVVFGY